MDVSAWFREARLRRWITALLLAFAALGTSLMALHLRDQDTRYGTDLEKLSDESPYLVCNDDAVYYGEGIEHPLIAHDLATNDRRIVQDTGGFNFPSGQQLASPRYLVVGGVGSSDLIRLSDGVRIAAPWNQSFIPMAMDPDGRVYGMQLKPASIVWFDAEGGGNNSIALSDWFGSDDGTGQDAIPVIEAASDEHLFIRVMRADGGSRQAWTVNVTDGSRQPIEFPEGSDIYHRMRDVLWSTIQDTAIDVDGGRFHVGLQDNTGKDTLVSIDATSGTISDGLDLPTPPGTMIASLDVREGNWTATYRSIDTGTGPLLSGILWGTPTQVLGVVRQPSGSLPYAGACPTSAGMAFLRGGTVYVGTPGSGFALWPVVAILAGLLMLSAIAWPAIEGRRLRGAANRGMRCPHCGSKMPAGLQFCADCGWRPVRPKGSSTAFDAWDHDR